MLDLCSFIFNFIGTGLTVIIYELIHFDQNKEARIYLLWIIFLSTLITMPVAVVRNSARINWCLSKGYVFTSFLDARGELLVELFIIALAPLPFLDGETLYFSNDFVDGEVLIPSRSIRSTTMSMSCSVSARPFASSSTSERSY